MGRATRVKRRAFRGPGHPYGGQEPRTANDREWEDKSMGTNGERLDNTPPTIGSGW
jgi:hypothetical protein